MVVKTHDVVEKKQPLLVAFFLFFSFALLVVLSSN
jgi:hypothetical protein